MSKVKDSNGKEFKFYDVSKDDHPELEGKIVKYSYSAGGGINAMVIGCNRSVGITLVDATNKDKNLICFQGPVTSEPSDFSNFECTYESAIDALITMINQGEVLPDVLLIMLHGHDGVRGDCTGACAYSQ